MKITELKILGYRNYLEADIRFDRNKVIIIGNNAQGKTNLLEIIQILTHLKSRRASKDAELVNFDLDAAIIHAHAERDNEAVRFALQIRKSGRRTVKINDVTRKPTELAHHIYSVSFMVDDLEIVTGSPKDRRAWIDSIAFQLNKDYKEDLAKFEKLLSQRNSFIKQLLEAGINWRFMNETQKEQMGIWDDLFIECANKITKHRLEILEAINPIAESYYKDICKHEHSLQLNYLGHKEISKQDLQESLAQDFARSYTCVGPHRADIEFLLKAELAGAYASQGEKRSITLALKLSELELLKNKYQDYPILLLDDVLAELDEDRQDYLLECIHPEAQVIVTTTHLGKHLEKWSDNAQILEIDNGAISARACANAHSSARGLDEVRSPTLTPKSLVPN